MRLPTVALIVIYLFTIDSVAAHPSIHRHLHKHHLDRHHESNTDAPPSLQVVQMIPDSNARSGPQGREAAETVVGLSSDLVSPELDEVSATSDMSGPTRRRNRSSKSASGLNRNLRIDERAGED